jgi:hypothetical protein
MRPRSGQAGAAAGAAAGGGRGLVDKARGGTP